MIDWLLAIDVVDYPGRSYGFDDCIVQASTPAGAKYRAFKQACEAGFFQGCFYAFLVNGVTVSEDRRAIRHGEASPEIGL
ncbi:hypothetical protein [Bradyrhizobium paxllaeri]|uniref:hypothetical protein n=1 Tax=Bradyrhizobium paxllaeri TaxID=190148 RepID=UPI00081091D7|nr:hypothetical protein [Bradyrhizobium paxllaeri]